MVFGSIVGSDSYNISPPRYGCPVLPLYTISRWQEGGSSAEGEEEEEWKAPPAAGAADDSENSEEEKAKPKEKKKAKKAGKKPGDGSGVSNKIEVSSFFVCFIIWYLVLFSRTTLYEGRIVVEPLHTSDRSDRSRSRS